MVANGSTTHHPDRRLQCVQHRRKEHDGSARTRAPGLSAFGRP